FHVADCAVLALGNHPPAALAGTEGLGERYQGNPWSARWLDDMDPDDRVLVVGTGLTMVDIVVSLVARKHRGLIWAISRRGLAPRAHAPYRVIADPFVACCRTHSLGDWVREVRKALGDGAERGVDWRAIVDALRPHVPAIWKGLDDRERRRFLRHLRPYWDVHRHRIAPEVAQLLADLQQRGQLRIAAARLQGLARIGDEVQARFRLRHDTGVQTLAVDRVINGTGPEGDFGRLGDPFVDRLLAKGIVRLDSLHLGLAVAEDFILKDASGRPSPRLFTLGPPCKGMLWESIAVPEIREQAQTIARSILRRFSRLAEAS
ncbi:MAG: hypothetical protein KGR26_13465, partial [Cyanobacteria bacterium REEB65]|nr:hypothetical protein [Cyanobacteria bacterium REEB65]